ncbi:MAG: thrombospondin type 3 repeat-containing protein, partial [Caldilineaceae bacterium]|nr:thrombospondin type 3 repeat-containing protein [Caldilineaceae bacterium]
DSDGVPDLFDRDNDNDGVPDAVDLAPLVKGATYAETGALNLTLKNLEAGKPTFVEFQLRPENPEQLWYSFNVLDWPQDEDGQMRDIDNVTFADYAAQQGRTAGLQEANGDMKLIPMLEIRMLAKDANLPPATTRTVMDANGEPTTRTVYPDLEPLGINVRDLEPSGEHKLVYVPLNVVTDESTGERVAFSGQMRYLPSGSWGSAHDVRLVWTVQALNDQPTARCDSTATPPIVDNCTADGYIHNVPQVIQSYTSGWNLTGLSVQEERGTTMDIAYGDPTQGTAPQLDDAVSALTTVLNSAFVTGRDIDNNGKRDFTAADLPNRFGRANPAKPDVVRYGLPNILQIETNSYATFDEALATTAITKTVGILKGMDGIAAGNANIKPLLLFAYEKASRSLSLDLLRAGNAYVSQSGNALNFDMKPGSAAAQTVSTMAGIRQVAYCPTAGNPIRWDPCSMDAYWGDLARRYDSILLPNETNPNLTAGRVFAAQLSYTAFNSGYTAVVEEGGRVVSGTYSLATDEAIEANVRYGLQIVGAGAPLMAEFAFENLVSASEDAADLLANINKGFDLFSGGVDDFVSNQARNLAKIKLIKADAAIGAVGAFIIVLSQML